MRSFDMGEAWQQVVAMFKGNREVLITVAGLFFFIPTLIVSLINGDPPQPEAGTAPEVVLSQMLDYFREAAPTLFLSAVASIIGTIAIWRLLLAPGGTSLGSALGVGATLFLSYLVASLLSGLAVGLGFLLLIVPGLYLYARLSLVGPAMAAEKMMNPIAAIQASWEATRNKGWVILAFIIVVALVGVIVMLIAGSVFGGLFALILPENIANMGGKTVDAILSAALSLAIALVVAAIYRQVGPQRQVETFS